MAVGVTKLNFRSNMQLVRAIPSERAQVDQRELVRAHSHWRTIWSRVRISGCVQVVNTCDAAGGFVCHIPRSSVGRVEAERLERDTAVLGRRRCRTSPPSTSHCTKQRPGKEIEDRNRMGLAHFLRKGVDRAHRGADSTATTARVKSGDAIVVKSSDPEVCEVRRRWAWGGSHRAMDWEVGEVVVGRLVVSMSLGTRRRGQWTA